MGYRTSSTTAAKLLPVRQRCLSVRMQQTGSRHQTESHYLGKGACCIKARMVWEDSRRDGKATASASCLGCEYSLLSVSGNT